MPECLSLVAYLSTLYVPDFVLAPGAIVIATLGAAFLALTTLKRMASSDRTLALLLTLIYAIFVGLTRVGFSLLPGPSSVWASTLLFPIASVVYSVVLFAISLLVIRTWWPRLLVRVRARLTPLGQEAIDTYVKEILNSNSFITALNDSLPRGERDAEFGLDSVPYLLGSIRSRRERLRRSSANFLRLTVIAASLIAIIITFFAWVLVNDESVGAPKALRSLRENTESIAASLRYLNSDYRSSTEFDRLKNAINAKADPANSATKGKLQAVLRRAEAGESLAGVLALLRQAAGELRYDTESYGRDVDGAIGAMDAQNTERHATIEGIGQLQPRLNGLIDRVGEELGKDQNRIAEVVRRIALGLIVATFFLAILRFVANLYRADYNQLLRTDFDDMLVRSFYVTFKASEGLGNQRAAVLSSYISALSTLAPSKTTEEEKGLSKEDSDLLKVILAAAAKKL